MSRLLGLVPWLRRRRAERQVRRELELHPALETRRNLESGMPPGEAARAARVALGKTTVIAGATRRRRRSHAHRSGCPDRLYTDRPRERVSSTAMCSRSAGSAVSGFRSRTTRSACFPTVIEPLVSSSKYW